MDQPALSNFDWSVTDPILHVIIGLIEDSPLSVLEIAVASGVSTRTIRLWQRGLTRKPMAYTVKAVLAALDHPLCIQRTSDNAVMLIPFNGDTGEPLSTNWSK